MLNTPYYKGYIFKDLFSRLFCRWLPVVTKPRSDLRGQTMTISDKLLLRKRTLTGTINDDLKNKAEIDHSRHRSVIGFRST